MFRFGKILCTKNTLFFNSLAKNFRSSEYGNETLPKGARHLLVHRSSSCLLSEWPSTSFVVCVTSRPSLVRVYEAKFNPFIYPALFRATYLKENDKKTKKSSSKNKSSVVNTCNRLVLSLVSCLPHFSTVLAPPLLV